MTLIAAGVAFYALLAIFPGIAALISVYGLLSDPEQVSAQLAGLGAVLPAAGFELLQAQLREVAMRSDQALGVRFIGALLIALWSATKGVRALITALNIVYDERDRRGLVALNALAFALTLFLVVLGIVVSILIVAIPLALHYAGLESLTQWLIYLLRWPVLALVGLFSVAVLYRYGPNRRNAQWRWVSWGAGFAVTFWIISSGLFSWYVAQFGSYNATYGSVGAVIVLLMWLFISAFVLLLGAGVNAEMERQTACDTTHGKPRPRGRRGAYVADHLPGED